MTTRNPRWTRRGNGMDMVDPLAAGQVQRLPERPLAYSVMRQMLDAGVGRRDGRIDVRTMSDTRVEDAPAPATAPTHTRCASMWLARNEATYLECDRREYLAAQATSAPMITQLRALLSAVALSQETHERAQVQRGTLPDEPSAEFLTSRGPAETRDTPAVVAMRRSDEHQGMLASRDAAVSAAGDRRAAVEADVARISATLETVYDVAITRTQRLREFHMRRADVYLRGYRRTVIRRRGTATLDFPGHAIAVPVWTTQPCPWTTPNRPLFVPVAS